MRLLVCGMLFVLGPVVATRADLGDPPTLVVAVRSLPKTLSPATAATEVERQCLDLLFDRLYQVEWQSGVGKRYVPRLATTLPNGSLAPAISLRTAHWSNGERVTAADVRHTALLMDHAETWGRSALWRDYLEVPRLEDDQYLVKLNYRQGLFDPQRPLTFWVLPRLVGGKELQRADDAEFAKAPLGCGPFRYVGQKDGAAEFEANPHDARRGSIGALRLVGFGEVRKDAKPMPHVILDAATYQLGAYKELGYLEKPLGHSERVHFLAVNHRKPALASAAVRRAIAHALDRAALVKKHFRGTAANGLFPRDSWAAAPAPRIPEFKAEAARSFARQADKGSLDITLKFPADDPRVKAACDEIVSSIQAVFQDAKVAINLKAVGLTPHDLRKAMHERDYDLAYTHEDGLDDPVRLALLFDRDADAVRAGGSNYLGYDGDLKLQELLRSALQHRQFSAVQEAMQAIHVHLFETMPAIPLWHIETHVLVHSSLRVPALNAHAVFASIHDWKIIP